MRSSIQRLLSLAGALLVLFGVGVLAYIGVSYAHQASPAHPAVQTWSGNEKKAAHTLASRLGGNQKVTVPRAAVNAAPGAPAVRIVIPRIGVDTRVVQSPPHNGIWDVADWAVGHLTTTPNPGVAGNGAYAAHDDIKGELFKQLYTLKPGSLVLLYSNHTLYRYVVTGQRSVDPSNVSVLAPTTADTVTLITCAPYWVDTLRLVVQATLKSSSPV